MIDMATKKREEESSWATYRTDSPIAVSVGNNGPRAIRKEPCGHSCPSCGRELLWANTLDFVYNNYNVHCRSCYNMYEIPKKYILPLVNRQLGSPEKQEESDSVASDESDTDVEENQAQEQNNTGTIAWSDLKEKREQQKAPEKKMVTMEFEPAKEVESVVIDGSMIKCKKCASLFERPARRGRPPVTCANCS